MCYRRPGVRCSPHCLAHLARTRADVWNKKGTYDALGTPEAHAAMKTAQAKVRSALRDFSLTPVGLQYIGREITRKNLAKWEAPKRFRVEVIQKEDNERRRLRRQALANGADVDASKRNLAPASVEFTHRDILPVEGITGTEIETLRHDHMGDPSVLVAITRHRRTTNTTLENIVRFSANIEVKSQAHAVLKRRQATRAARTRRDAARRAAARQPAAQSASTLAQAA